ncbi:DUF221-domain-containing protein [Bimuria novae-zelandiae CBS 107.79]|uniref:DUF221-domain-containing protein n=1 Tax=Bimuria novae-zelandiae CBS 107.79 TaxID=1447943 RepID=A0A6A5V2X1_9PLEO|nr:DUF221-domain-containing protein [Bimuria novae-zelandiae CBS 107.79]
MSGREVRTATDSPPADLDFNNSFAKAQQLSGVSLSSFLASLSTSLAIFALEILVFFAIRGRFPEIYASTPETPTNKLTKSIATWYADLLRFERDRGHLDRYFFQRYVRTLLLIFLPAALLITPILLPTNYINGKAAKLGVSGIDTLGWSNVGLDHSDRYWVHLILAFLFIAHVCWILWNEFTSYVAIRQNSPSAALRTMLIDAIPGCWMDEARLASQFSVFPGKITAISFNRDFRKLSLLVAQRDALARSLESAETRYIRDTVTSARKRGGEPNVRRDLIRPPAPSRSLRGLLAWLEQEKVDAILYRRRELRRVTEEIELKRSMPEDFLQLPSAFITFEDPLAAHMACQTVIHTNPGYMTPRTLPTSVDDIVWDNVCITWWERNVRTVASNVVIAALAMLCVVPVALIGLLSQIIYLTRALEWLRWVDRLPEWSLGLFQGVLPPVLLAVLVKAFSAALQHLVRKQGISSKSIISLRVQDFYFCFLFLQTTLVVSLSAGLTSIANEVASGQSLAATLAKNLPKASNYFLSYVLLQALSTSANSLLRIDRLVARLFLAPIFDKTVTQKLVRQKGADIEWGVFLPVYTNLACIERDSGGLFYPKALKHLVAGLYLMECSLTALFFLTRNSRGEAACIAQACLMAITIPLTAVYHHLVRKAFNPLLIFSPTSIGDTLTSRSVKSFTLEHRALASASAIRIPKDDLGISSNEAAQLREALKSTPVLEDDATITSSGRITLLK